MRSLRSALCLASLLVLAACDDSDAGKTVCQERTTDATLEGHSAIACTVQGEKLTLTGKVASCAGLPLRCRHLTDEKTKAVGFRVDSKSCTTEGEVVSGGCGDATQMSCEGPLPAVGTYAVARDPLKGEEISLRIEADGTCSVK